MADTTKILYKEKLLGNVLWKRDIITEEELQKALEYQANQDCKLGEALIKMGYATEEQITKVLAKQFGLPYIDFRKEISPSVIKMVPKEISERYNIIPVKKLVGAIRVAISDPLDLPTIDDLRLVLDCDIECALATTTNIRTALKKYYRNSKTDESEKSQEIQKQPEVEEKEIEAKQELNIDPDSMGLIYKDFLEVEDSMEKTAVQANDKNMQAVVDKLAHLYDKMEKSGEHNPEFEKILAYERKIALRNQIIVALAMLCFALIVCVIVLLVQSN